MFNIGTLVASIWLEAYQTVWKIVPSCMKNIREYAAISWEFPRELHSEIHSVELHIGYKRERHSSVWTSDSDSNSEHHLYTTLVVTSVSRSLIFACTSLTAEVSRTSESHSRSRRTRLSRGKGTSEALPSWTRPHESDLWVIDNRRHTSWNAREWLICVVSTKLRVTPAINRAHHHHMGVNVVILPRCPAGHQNFLWIMHMINVHLD